MSLVPNLPAINIGNQLNTIQAMLTNIQRTIRTMQNEIQTMRRDTQNDVQDIIITVQTLYAFIGHVILF